LETGFSKREELAPHDLEVGEKRRLDDGGGLFRHHIGAGLS
jgi:hypothetical protein